MHYSKLLLVGLPLVAAMPVAVIETVTSIIYTTSTLTITANGQILTSLVDVASTVTAEQVVPTSEAIAAPVSVAEASAPVPVETEVAVSPNPGNSASGCPSDARSPSSPGVNGNPERSMLDSINYVRRLYNPNAKCLGWSPSLATASSECANAATESLLRPNSAIVSDNGGFASPDPFFTGSLATTQFERSLFVLLCQSPSDPQLQGQCQGKVGEIGCSAGACTGHHAVLVDSAGEYDFVGAGVSFNTNWMSASFSKTCEIFGGCN